MPIDLSGAGQCRRLRGDIVISGVISGSAGLTKNGAGTLDLTATNTYYGNDGNHAGTLLVDGVQAGSPVTAASGTTLGGVGTVGSITAAGATLIRATGPPAC